MSLNLYALAFSDMGIASFTLNSILLITSLMVFGLPMLLVLLRNQEGHFMDRRIGL